MITAISWVPKGVSKCLPTVVEAPTTEEIEEILKSGAFGKSEESECEDNYEDMDDSAIKKEDGVARALAAANALGKSSRTTNSNTDCQDITSALQELDMEHYDEEENGMELFGVGLENIYYPSNEMDPYLHHKDDDNDSEELENMPIRDSDAVIVCARNEGFSSFLEVFIYEDSDADGGEANMYPHHETPIPAFPLCVAWLDFPSKGIGKGNFLAVGTMNHSIEIWDLDLINEVQPLLVLGGNAEPEDSHTDAVLGLAWNMYRNAIASASADKLVKVWDVASGECDITMAHHTDKVQAVAWNHHVRQVLLTGSFDRTVVMRDVRDTSHTGFKWSVSADVESVAWDPHNEHSFVVSLHNGIVDCFDVRAATTSSQSSGSKPIFTLHAHNKEVCAISYNHVAPNLLATGSADKKVKLWDLSNNQPSCIASKNPKAGAVFSISFSKDNPFLLAIGGSKGDLKVWDTLSDAKVSQKYRSYSKGNSS